MTAHANVGDIWGLDGESAAVSNVIIDHVTAIASTDGVFDIYGDVNDVTISWNLIMDTVTACHLSTGSTDSRNRISIHHNVCAGNNERQIRIRHDNDDIDFVNNVIYGWGWMEAGEAGLHIVYDAGQVNPSLNVIGNVFHNVTTTGAPADSAIHFGRGTSEGQVYFSDNILPSGETDNQSTAGQLTIPETAKVNIHAASTLEDTVVPYTGTHYPTSGEETLLGEIRAALR